MIRAEGLTKFYGSRCVIKDLSFSIEDREIVGFLGLNGAGKTTALRMMAGLLQPSSGRLQLDGQDVLEDPKAMGWRIGFLPERPPVYEEMTVGDYLTFAAELRGYPKDKSARRVSEVIERTELKEYEDEPILHLSHGFRQRVGIAQAIVHEPDLVILDEPINGLDPKQIVEMRGLIRSLGDEHIILISSHILPEISQTCDRLLVLSRGELVAQGTESELRAQFGGSGRLRVSVVGNEEEVSSVLERCPLLASFETVGRAGDAVEFRVELKEQRPEALSRFLVEAGLGLRRLEPEKSELETMFIQLTRG